MKACGFDFSVINQTKIKIYHTKSNYSKIQSHKDTKNNDTKIQCYSASKIQSFEEKGEIYYESLGGLNDVTKNENDNRNHCRNQGH